MVGCENKLAAANLRLLVISHMLSVLADSLRVRPGKHGLATADVA